MEEYHPRKKVIIHISDSDCKEKDCLWSSIHKSTPTSIDHVSYVTLGGGSIRNDSKMQMSKKDYKNTKTSEHEYELRIKEFQEGSFDFI